MVWLDHRARPTNRLLLWYLEEGQRVLHPVHWSISPAGQVIALADLNHRETAMVDDEAGRIHLAPGEFVERIAGDVRGAGVLICSHRGRRRFVRCRFEGDLAGPFHLLSDQLGPDGRPMVFIELAPSLDELLEAF